ncbi:hypothetical protein BSL78_06487 [Apostichopus japonicus]|uniref:Ig-like domain-containing protein n=1 Tax=Stichopus japonicus TaxID=307972 RepID=A0A2G8L8Q1_STIJA|nr:hypothetical protein BSL78_06487 [Apostichopus japonicus]
MVVPVITSAWLVLVFASSAFTGMQLSCPSYIIIEKGHNATIGCNTSEPPTEVLWYVGSTSSTSPILALENNLKSGTLYDSSRFDITSNGDVIISNAQLEDEALYTVVAFFATGNYETETITVSIKVSPQKGCPLIAKCSSCSNCSLQINRTGQLQCTVSESRPKVPLRLEIRRSEHLQFTTGESISQKNEKLGTWDTSTSAKYSFDACGGFADIRCLAQDDINLLHRKDSYIRITSDPCPAGEPAVENTSTISPQLHNPLLWLWVVISMVVVVFLVLSLILLIFCLRKKTNGRHETKKYGGERAKSDEVTIAMSRQEGSHQKVENFNTRSQKQRSLNKKDKSLSSFISCLCDSYAKHLHINLYYHETVSVDIDTIYVDSQCIVTRPKNKGQYEVSTETLYSNPPTAKWVALTAGLGFGKTTLILKMISQWIQQDEKTFVLIYIHLTDSNYQMSLVDLIMKKLPDDSGIETNDVNKILSEQPVIVLIDGLSDLCSIINVQKCHEMQKEEHVTKASASGIELYTNENEYKTLAQLATTVQQYHKMRMWVASRNLFFSYTDEFLTIELRGFNENQVKDLCAKMYLYHDRSRTVYHKDRNKQPITENSSLLDSPEPSTDHGDCNNESNTIDDESGTGELDKTVMSMQSYSCQNEHDRKTDDSIVKKMIYSLSYSKEFLKELYKVPLFVTTRLYLNAVEVTKPGNEHCDYCRMSKILETHVNSMEKHYVTKGNNTLCDKSEFLALRKTIGEAFYKGKKSIEYWQEESRVVSFQAALSIGLLKVDSNNVDSYHSKATLTTVSPDNCVDVAYPFCKEFFLGHYLPPEQTRNILSWQTKLTKYDFNLALMFVSGLSDNDTQQAQILEALRKQGMWNAFIDCFHEVDLTVKNRMINSMHKKAEITITKTEIPYQQHNVEDFLTFCSNENVPNGTFVFEGDFSVQFLTNLSLPNAERFVISKKKLEDNDILKIALYIAKKIKVELRFHNCAMNTLCQETITKLGNIVKRQKIFTLVYSTGDSWKNVDTRTIYNFEYWDLDKRKEYQ